MDKRLNLVVDISRNVMIISFICKVGYLLWVGGFFGKWDHAPGPLTATFVISGCTYFLFRFFQWYNTRWGEWQSAGRGRFSA